MATELVGASVWEAKLYEHLTSHEESERSLLVEYQEAADGSGSPAFRYLCGLIVEDEIRHHRIFRELASALRTDAELRPEAPEIPRLDRWGPDASRVVELSRALLERERSDARELRRLAAHLKGLEEDTMWHLLVRLMEMDTAKHVAILEFIEDRARKAAR
jgi:hypothetical protein